MNMPLILPLLEQKQEQLYRKLSIYGINNIFIGTWPTEKHFMDIFRIWARLIISGLGLRKEKKYPKSAQPTYKETQEEYRRIQEAITEEKDKRD